MKILLTNDDGIEAPGLAALCEAARGQGELVVVAPEENCSGASSSLSLHRPVTVRRAGERRFAVDGTPADCVHLALSGGFVALPDLIVSGINEGANLGDDTLYSGTVAAAIEGHLFGIPAVAFSMTQKPARHFATGLAVARKIIARFARLPAGEAMLLNVNIPDIPDSELRGVCATRLGRRHAAMPATVKKNRDGYCCEIGDAGAPKDAAAGTDFYATENRRVSVTPLTVDLTRHRQMSALMHWLTNE